MLSHVKYLKSLIRFVYTTRIKAMFIDSFCVKDMTNIRTGNTKFIKTTWRIYFLILFNLSNAYNMNGNMYCGSKISMVSNKVFQVRLGLDDYNIYDDRRYSDSNGGICEIKVEAWYNTYHKLMFYFENLNLDCNNGHLEFFVVQNTDTRVKGLRNDVCGHTKPNGVFTGETRLLKIRYVPRKSQIIKDVFSIVITAFREDTCPRYAYECDNSRCIDKDLACNGYDSCGDGSGCNLSTGTVAGIVTGCVVTVAFFCIVVIYCIRRKRRKRERFCNLPSHLQGNQISEVGIDDTQSRDHASYSLPSVYVVSIERDCRPQTHHEESRQTQEGSDDLVSPPSYTELFGSNSLHIRQNRETLNERNLTNKHSSVNVLSIEREFRPQVHEERSQTVDDFIDMGPLPSYTELFGTNQLQTRGNHEDLSERHLANIRVHSNINNTPDQDMNYLPYEQDEQNLTQSASNTEIVRSNESVTVTQMDRPTTVVLETPI